jgi:hypothetical protein
VLPACGAQVFVCYAQAMFELQRDLRDGPDAPLRPTLVEGMEAVAEALDVLTARIGALASTLWDPRPLHLRQQQPGELHLAGGARRCSRTYRKSTNSKANLSSPMFWHKVLQQYLSANTFSRIICLRITAFTVHHM